ncbi:MAG TPA: sulfurtransferase TusA family protein [Thermomicrobiales bacterium]|nr:sulfurtransferase TusA family protein [Thermomicrobiales bacterium]
MANLLDVCGQTCPGPTTDTLDALKRLPEGATLEVLSDYLPARYTIPSLMHDLGYPTEVRDNDDGTFTVVVQKVAPVIAS